MIFRTPLSVPPTPSKITHADSLFCIGSCFARNIASFFERYRFDAAVNPLGVVFNPASIADSVVRIATRRFFTPDELRFHPVQGVWFTLDAYSEFNDPSKEVVLARLNRAVEEAYERFVKSSTVIITLGTTWVYEYEGAVVANCQKLPAASFARRAMSAAEVEERMAVLFSSEPFVGKRVVLTVSPIRHLKNGFVENCFSKSSLICAAHALVERFGRVDYFPSYEIMMDDLRDYRFYDTDMVHPSLQAIEYIWEQFTASYLDEQTQALLPEIDKVNKALAHRPLHPDTEQHQRHLAAVSRQKEALNHKAGVKLF